MRQKRVVVLIIAVLFLCFTQVSCKVYTKCGLALELSRRSFPRSFIGNWVCMIESESSKDTSKVTTKANGSKNLGIFQINSKEWCRYNQKGGKCNMKCEDLINENLEDDSSCAKKVFNEYGFQNWDGWKRSCKGRTLPLPNCKEIKF
ncbi:lysozyme-like [Agrilus planipennis]|uniref:lysozyme n=1 Tax=Agrilus planipennis TaxID=224129 RepID=A0A1W4WME1_AGRPL|nr:lysozyme-like [Agrilus planipennis]